MLDNYFLKAKPIYPNSLIEEMNVSLFFVSEVEITNVAKLVITANNLYRIFDNGNLLGYGPARAAHDYYRVDSYELNKGKHHIVIEHVYYHCNNYCSTNTKPFLQCEIIEDKNCCHKQTHRTKEEKKIVNDRLNRIEGQIKGIKKMIDEDRYCNDVLIQLSAVENSIRSLSNHILENHLYTCVSDDLEKGNLEIIDELTSLFKRFNK